MKLLFTYSLFSAMLSWFGVPETNPTPLTPVKHTPESAIPHSSYIRVAADWGLLYGHLDLPLKDAVEITRLADRAPVGMAPIIAVTKEFSISNDIGLAGASPGDELTYTITITNSGAMDATALSMTDQIDPNTTLVAGSLKRSPILYADTYNCIGNVGLNVNTAAGGVIGNDLDLDGDAIQATAIDQSGTQGTVTMNPDGTFTFKPAAGFEGTTTFTYTASDGLFASIGTVTINVSRMIWFVDNNAGVNGDGRLGTPFNSMANFNAGAADDAGDIIFLYRNTATNYAGPLTLLNNQFVIGAGASSSIASIAGITVPSFSNALPSTGGTNPVLAHTATNLTLGQTNKLHGFNINNTVGGVALTGSGTASLQIRDMTIAHTAGQAINLTTGGALDVILRSVSAAGTGTGILISGTTGSFQIAGSGTTDGSGGTISNITNRGVDIQNATNITLKNMTFTNANTVDAGTCNAANNTLCNAAIHLATVTTAVLNNVDINGTTEQGINLSTVTGFSLIGSTLINCGVASGGGDTEESCLYGVNVDGTCAITSSSLTKPSERAAVIYNTNKTLALTVTNSTFGDNQSSTLGADGLEIDNLGSSNLTLDVVNSTFTMPKTNGLQVISDNTAVASVDITGSTFDAGPTNLAAAIDLVTAGTANMDFNIIGNPLIKSRGINAVNIQGQGSSTFQGRVADNPNITTTSGSGIPIRVLATANSVGKVLIQNNVAVGADDFGLLCGSNGGTGRLDANILNNNVSIGSLGFYCIQAIAGASSSTFTNKTCANIANNTTSFAVGAIANAQYRAATVSHQLLVQGGGATAATNWNANTNSPLTPTAVISQSGTGVFTFGSTCLLPTNPLPLVGNDPVAEVAVADPGNAPQTDTPADEIEKSAEPVKNTPTVKGQNGAEAMMSGETVTTGPVTVPANSTFRILFRATIDSPFPAGVCSVSNQASVSGSNFSTVLSDDPGVAGAANPTVTTVNTLPAITTCPPSLTVNPNNANCTSTQAFAAVVTGCPTPTVTYKIGVTTITSP
ncbi:MAG: beta strand repeat-containing protein, partial [Saprospiraceae bacterium]